MSEPLRLEIQDDGLAVVVFEHPASRVNKIDQDVIAALEGIIARFEANPPRGVVFLSARDHFCVGADVALIASLDGRARALEGSRAGQALFDRLEALPCPTVIGIHGSCLGGGTEWALACDRIVATEGGQTRLGLPEVRLGILPAWGGSQRLPQRIGFGPAVQLMATGRSVSGESARKRGLVDRVVPAAGLRAECISLAKDLAATPRPKPTTRGWLGWLCRWLPPVRSLVFNRVRAEVKRQAGPHYPAPVAIVEAVERSMGGSREAGLERERELFADLVTGKVSRHLVGLFLLNQESKSWYEAEEAAATVDVQRVAVLGAGIMGSGIAHLAAAGGLRVLMRDISDDALAAGLGRIRKSLDTRVERRRMSRDEADAVLARIEAVTDLESLAGTDVVIEAIIESMDLKKRVLGEAARKAPDAFLASNTSALSVETMAADLPQPSRLAGLHFFNPVEKMPLVEVIAPRQASPEIIGVLVGLSRRLGKVPVRVADAPGFLVNRILSIYLGEAVQMVVEGNEIGSIDRLMRDFGMPMGPLELLDQIGLDVATKVVATLQQAFPDRMPPGDLLDRMVADDRTGEKGGLGFYRHAGKQRTPDQEGVADLAGTPARRKATPDDVARLVFPMISEAVRCLEEQVVTRPGEVDLSLVMGIGWPPFRGGLLRFADDTGVAEVVRRLEALAVEHPRLAPPDRLRLMGDRGLVFYPLKKDGCGASPPAARPLQGAVE